MISFRISLFLTKERMRSWENFESKVAPISVLEQKKHTQPRLFVYEPPREKYAKKKKI